MLVYLYNISFEYGQITRQSKLLTIFLSLTLSHSFLFFLFFSLAHCFTYRKTIKKKQFQSIIKPSSLSTCMWHVIVFVCVFLSGFEMKCKISIIQSTSTTVCWRSMKRLLYISFTLRFGKKKFNLNHNLKLLMLFKNNYRFHLHICKLDA